MSSGLHEMFDRWDKQRALAAGGGGGSAQAQASTPLPPPPVDDLAMSVNPAIARSQMHGSGTDPFQYSIAGTPFELPKGSGSSAAVPRGSAAGGVERGSTAGGPNGVRSAEAAAPPPPGYEKYYEAMRRLNEKNGRSNN
jgi:hypothetical protein